MGKNMKAAAKNKFLLAFFAIFLVSLAFRFYALDSRIVHHDEGVFAISFIKPLYESGEYRYDPRGTYHGPLLYYFGALSFLFFGITEFALRFWPALFSSLTVLLLYPLRKYIGDVGVLAAALFIAVSPAMNYYSREAMVHENFFVFFQLLAIAAFLLYFECKQSRYIYIGFASLAFMLTTKESAYAIIFLLAVFLAGNALLRKTKDKFTVSLKENSRYAFSYLSRNRRDILTSILIAFTIFATFYTSFFRHPGNLLPTITDAIPSMISTSQTSVGHHKPFFYYTEMLVRYELPVLAFALTGMLYSRKSAFGRLWSYLLVVTWLLFSAVAYKTPWNIVHIMLPLAVVAGIGAQGLYEKLGRYVLPILAVAFIYTAWVSVDANYISHSAQDNQLAYVTTAPELLNMINRIYAYNTSAEINVLTSDYWPLPWYLREYVRTGYHGRIIDESDADVVIVKKEDKEALNLTGTYESADYQLRYGVWLAAFYRK